jgi:hypothetical protein
LRTHETVSSFRTVANASDRKFGITFGLILLAFAFWQMFRGASGAQFWLLGAGLGFLAAAWLHPAWLAPLNRAWFRVGLALNGIMSPIIMALLYFGAVVPLGLLLRRNGKDLLQLEGQEGAETYWIPRDPPGPLQGTFNKQF